MSKKLLALTLAVVLFNLFCVAPVAANTKQADEARRAEKVKDEIARLGTGPKARIEVSLRDGAKLKGYVRESDATHFVVVEAKTGAATTVLYPQVQKVKGNNLSTGVKIAFVVGVAVGTLLLVTGLCALIPSCAGS